MPPTSPLYAGYADGIRRLRGMGSPSTVDSFQGQENDIIVVMGTSLPQFGPGFTTDPHRLNVLLTRQRCGLVVVGDIDIRAPDDNAGAGAAVGLNGNAG